MTTHNTTDINLIDPTEVTDLLADLERSGNPNPAAAIEDMIDDIVEQMIIDGFMNVDDIPALFADTFAVLDAH